MLDVDLDDPILETDTVVVASRSSERSVVTAAVPAAANGGSHCLDKLTAYSQ